MRWNIIWLIVVLVLAAWFSWMGRYDVQVIPVLVPELDRAGDNGFVLDAEGRLLAVDGQSATIRIIMDGDGRPFRPLIQKTPLVSWRWDRWLGDGRVMWMADVDAAGRVTLKDNGMDGTKGADDGRGVK